MPVQFRFASLSIRGFRGLREFDVELPARKPLHLIGSNNSGKTTVLEAMALALGGGGFHQFEPSEFDFFHSATGEVVRDFTVTLHFTAQDVTHLPAVQGIGNPIPVHAVQVKGSTDSAGRLSHRRLLLDDTGKAITYSPRTALKGETKAKYKGRSNLGWSQPYARLDEIRADMPEVWLLTPQNLHRSLYDWKTGPLQRLSRILARRFLEVPWEYAHKGKSYRMPETLMNMHSFFQECVELFPFWQQDLKPRLQDVLSQYVGTQSRLSLQPDIQQFEEWVSQRLAVSFAADLGGAVTPLSKMGDGWQSLIRLAALDVLSRYNGEMTSWVVVLAEEPETHLHPHLRRKMRSVFERLAEQGWVVLSATHSPEFISLSRPQVIVKLQRHADEVSKGILDTSLTTDAVRAQEKLNERGNHEMLFGQRLVLCEGKNDCWAIKSGLQKLDATLDLDARGVTLVDAGSVRNFPDYVQIARRMSIPWCAVTDQDIQPDGDSNPITKGVRKRIDALRTATDTSLTWVGKLEVCLGVPAGQKATPEWQAAHTDPKSLTQMEIDHGAFVSTCRHIHNWITQS